MTTPTTAPARGLTLEEMRAAAPIPATETMPPDIAALVKPDSGIYIRANYTPNTAFQVGELPGATGDWRVLESDGQIRSTIPGLERTELEFDPRAAAPDHDLHTEGYRPPWVEQRYLPDLAPYPLAGRQTGLPEDRMFLEAFAAEAERFPYPWRTIGKVYTPTAGGTGYLVGPNLVLTAGHVMPWDQADWWVQFIPAYRDGDSNPTPFGWSYVSEYRGYRPQGGSPFGYDYALCRLYQPLGNALGWMGTRSAGDDDIESRSYTSSGYPDSYGGRPAVNFSLGIRDIDNDSPGREYETVHHVSSGWSGGPLWYFAGTNPYAIGVTSGYEKDGLDPTRDVYAGSSAMTDLVRFGLDNWRP
ncbi:trypsin-like serine protease [Mycobacterium sp. ITM-2016-00317]|uniref:trypsin-like serine peptidase n=1 Tax=Mycobacterium sp. ITM-2016-00317 TaxID=2099694 RepID=UPI00287FE9AC|nr:trypsin-like serine protease [Mycobacterium sp. ITM-2016-00317]WNG87800.1 trypsin-like serine protease [Mycobacterium sp. ITM-2016-00317]